MNTLQRNLALLATSLLAWAATPAAAATINVSGSLTGTANVWKATNEYVLNGFVYVLDGATLKIEPGTVVRGVAGSNNGNFGNLFVCRGGKIFAEGTPQKPIIFTAEDDDLLDPTDLTVNDVQHWGGIILLGRARINNAVNAGGDAASPKYDIYEGLPDTAVSGEFVHRFGGSNDDDSSGVMRYVSIRHGGKVLESNKEVNGLSICGVGRGTTIEYIEVFANSDDGFEFFGGSVNTRYLVSAFNEDEQFDADQGYNGKNQFWFGIQKTNSVEKGMELNGEPQDRITHTGVPVSNFEVYNATLIGAGARASAGSGNNAFTFRADSKPFIHNSIFTEFNGQPVTGSAFTTGANPVVQNNIWWGFSSNAFLPSTLFAAANNNTTNANPLLRGISRTNDHVLDPRPFAGSPAFSTFKTTPTDGFYCPADYRGAFSSGDLWMRKWTFLDQGGFLPPNTNVVNVAAGFISGNVTWSSSNIYVLQGFVYVVDGATLTIEPGTVIKGVPGTGSGDFGNLFVCRGGRLIADGAPHNPIIFTASTDDLDDPTDLGPNDVQLWGGIILLGKARINNAVNAGGDAASPKYDIYEGLSDAAGPGGQFLHRFGGSDDNDDSGVLRYVSIRHGGKILESNKEVNGLSLCGVGRKTVVECVEVFANSDDGFEFFGGSVNTRYLISAFNEDEQFDADQGYNGKNQFWFGIQKTNSVEKGMELNGEPQDRITHTGVPVSNFEVYNATLIGAGARASAGSGNNAFTFRADSKPFIHNSIFTEFNGQPVTGSAFTTGANPVVQDNIWWRFSSNAFLPASMFLAVNNNTTAADPLLGGISRTNDFGLDPRPATGSPAFTGYRPTPVNGFYIDARYQGAFDRANWAVDWTALANTCFLTSSGGTLKKLVPAVDMAVTTQDGGATADVAWTGVAGRLYRLQSTTDMATWLDETAWLSGAGATLTQNVAVPGKRKMFRVLVR